MTPAVAKAMYRRQMAAHGEMVTLRRPVGTGVAAPIDVQVRVWIKGYLAEEIVGGVTQGDRKITVLAEDLAAAGFPVPPRKNDKIIVRGKVLSTDQVDDNTRRIAGELIAYDIVATGA